MLMNNVESIKTKLDSAHYIINALPLSEENNRQALGDLCDALYMLVRLLEKQG